MTDMRPLALPPIGMWPVSLTQPALNQPNLLGAWQEYGTDLAQRWVLFLDTLRRRGNTAVERADMVAPNVLGFAGELLIDGRTLPRPVNYGLVRVLPPDGVATDARKRPFIIFDPRAGHGPGIGGMKPESEIGAALRAGHPCYFVGFAREPVPGQTIEDVCRAEALFVRTVIDRHPAQAGKPVLIGNCQAGWQIMMMASLAPDLPGPILLAGAPLSYWAGVRGRAPLRYLGGLLGGTWLTALAGDLGAGIFDGAALVSNFESMNPANTLWTKPYEVFSNVDAGAQRFLDFERWWGSPVLLNAGEMQWIADNLFVGNRLTAGRIIASDGLRVDLRNIRSPIIVFCSWGDDITPPQQALGWVLDLYRTEAEIAQAGQTIVYTLHPTIGHLGIFVSGKVATKEHGEFVQCMDMIDAWPPGLYEAVIEGVPDHADNPDLIQGKYLFRLRPRTLADIRALGTNSAEDDLRFATVARVSEAGLGLYRTTLGPLVRAMMTPEAAEAQRQTHPLRTRFAAFSDKNPMMAPVAAAAETVRAQRTPVSPDNPFLALEKMGSTMIETTLSTMGALRDAWVEATFHAVYGQPWLQAWAGMLGTDAPQHGPGRDLAREASAERHHAKALALIGTGGTMEALVRAMLWVMQAVPEKDERAFWALTRLRRKTPEEGGLTLPQFRDLVRDQAMVLRADPERAIAALPALLPQDAATRASLLEAVREVATAAGPPGPEATARLERLAAMAG